MELELKTHHGKRKKGKKKHGTCTTTAVRFETKK
jgi:hypothetical protein